MKVGSLKSRLKAVRKLYSLVYEARYNNAIVLGSFGTWN